MSHLNFERMTNDLRHDEILKLTDIYKALKNEASEDLMFKNEYLVHAIENDVEALTQFEDGQKLYDPFKERVVDGIAKGLTSASINH